jgi:thymidylate synthase
LVDTYFVKNTDPDKNIIVNHIDNNSLNNHYSNLEWCTYSHNTQHSYDYTDRKSINKIIYLTNIKTSELFIFKSIYEVAKFLNIDRSSISHYISKRTNKEYLIEHYSNIEDISRINEKYKRLLKEVINKGFSYEDPNRIGVNRLQIPTYTFSHYFKSEGFPILTLKKSFVESAFKEMKMFMSGESDLKVLKKEGINFWDKDGYTFAKRQGYKETFEEFIDFVKNKGFDLGSIYPHHMRNFNNTTDQIKNLIDNLKTNPFATKKTVTMWNPSDTNYCLSPCHWAFEAIVTPPVSVGRKNRLTIKWHQHSTDVFLGLPMNIMYYSFVCLFLAKCCNMEAFGIIGDLSNVHLYENSVIAAKKVINTDNTFPKVKVITSLELSDDIDKMLNTFSYSIDDTNHGGVLNVEMLPYSF